MRYLIIIVLMFAASCVGLNKEPNPAPKPEPTQEDLLDQYKVQEVQNFWEQEKEKLGLFFFKETGVVVGLDLINIHFFNNYDLGMLEIKISHEKELLDCYMVISPEKNKGWVYQSMICKNPKGSLEEEAQKDMI